MTNLADLVRESAIERPTHPALVTRSSRLTWAELDRAVDRSAWAFTESGLAPGDRVALMIGNRPEFAVAYFGLLRAGLVAVPVNTGYTAPEVGRLCSASGASILLHDRHAGRAAKAVDRRIEGLEVVSLASDRGQSLSGTGRDGRGPFASPRTPPKSLAVLMFTSGSEGTPKGAMLSHGALRANVDALARLRKPAAMTADDVVLLVLPLFHIYGLNAGLGLAAKVGATCVLMDRFDPAKALAAIRDLGVTHVGGAPPMYVAWSAEGALRESMTGVRLFVSGAAALPVEVFETFQGITGKPIWEGYGLTECSPVVASTLVSQVPKPGSVGKPLPGVEISLRDEDGRDVVEGDPGELWVRGRNLLTGYWPDGAGGPDEDGWFHTGDVAIVDDDGDYHLVDRRRDLIIVSGFNVYPREVEEVLVSHPAVAEAAVLGMPHPITGESVRAVIVLRAGAAEPDDLREFCEARLARFKCPSVFQLAEKLPRAPTGKVTRGKLRDLRA